MKKNLHLLSHSSINKGMISLPVLCFAFAVAFSQAQLLKDINQQDDIYTNEYSNLTAGSDKVYFIGNGNELWKTTGNAGGTVRVRPFRSISNLTPIGATVFFTADDGSGPALWKSTGTFGSTMKVKDFVSGGPASLTVVNDKLYFSASSSSQGRELWKSDGTPAGTVLVRDIQVGTRSSDPAWLTNVNGTLFFTANDGKTGHEVWKSDGTASGTVLVKDVRPGAYHGSTPSDLTNAGGTLFFVAFDGVTGRELYKSNGTPEGTFQVADIRPGYSYSGIENLTAVNNTVFFTANDGVHGHELWKSDGTKAGTVLVKDMTPGGNGSHGTGPFTFPMGNFKAVSGLLFYTAYQSDTYYIWKSDGTEAGTVPLFVSSHGIGPPTPRFVPMGKYIYYFDMSEDDASYYEFHLYRMNANGTNPVIVTTLVIQDFYTTYEPELVMLFNTLYFWGRDDYDQGFKLFRSDGIPGSPGRRLLIKDINKIGLSSAPERFTRMGNKMFFIAEDRLFESGLWMTDGTGTGTTKVQEFDYASGIAATSSHVYYTVDYGLELWKSNGTPEGTMLVKKDANAGSASNLLSLNDRVFFETFDHRLWITDGSEQGTFPLLVGKVNWKEVVGDMLLFTVDRGDNLIELWRSDGTSQGTLMIYSFKGKRRSFYNPRAVSGAVLYFVADDGLTGNEVWRTDGTAQGTYRIADINSADDHLDGNYESDIRSLEVWNSELYISAYGNTHGWALYNSNGARENIAMIRTFYPIADMIPTTHRLHLFAEADYATVNQWATDGTADGTEQINHDLLPQAITYAVIGDVLYFNGVHSELWRSDGTECGTFAIDLGVSEPIHIEALGSLLIFNAYSPQYGAEPYVYDVSRAPQSPCGAPALRMAARSADNVESNVNLTSYPNPFMEEISIHVTASEAESFSVQVYSQSGFPIEAFTGLKANTDYRLGRSWKPGHYILRVNVSGKVTSQQVLKD